MSDLKNKSRNNLATKVSIQGDLSAVKTPLFPAFLNLIKNGWIKAYENGTDNEIQFSDAKQKD